MPEISKQIQKSIKGDFRPYGVENWMVDVMQHETEKGLRFVGMSLVNEKQERIDCVMRPMDARQFAERILEKLNQTEEK